MPLRTNAGLQRLDPKKRKECTISSGQALSRVSPAQGSLGDLPLVFFLATVTPTPYHTQSEESHLQLLSLFHLAGSLVHQQPVGGPKHILSVSSLFSAHVLPSS